MRRALSVATLALGLCAVLADRAGAQSARVERRGPAHVAAAAGETVTLPFRVTNLSASPSTLDGQLTLPPGWRPAVTGAPRALEPGEAELRLVAVRVPAGTAAGRYVVSYAAGAGRDSGVVFVAARRGIAVEPGDGPAMVIAGEPYAVTFRVINRGNVPERVSVRVQGDQGIDPQADSSVLVLAPAGERLLTVRGRADARLRGSVRHQVTVDVAGDSIAARGRRALTLVTRGSVRVPRPRIPVQAWVRASDSLRSPALGLSAHGPVDRRGQVLLDVEMRGADPPGTPFSRQSEYRFALVAPDASLRLGDGVYGVSPLTAPLRYGFGGAAQARRGWIESGVAVSRDRRLDTRTGFAGGFLRVGTERARVGGSVALHDTAGTRWSLEGRVAPSTLLVLEAEGGPRPESPETLDDDGGPARRLRLSGTSRPFSYEGVHQRGAAPSGWGRLSRDEDYASATIRPGRGTYLSGSFRRGAEVRSIFDTVPGWARTARLTAGWGNWLLLEGRETEGTGRGYGDLRSVRARLGIPVWERAWLYPLVEVGESRGPFTREMTPFRIYALQSTVNAAGTSWWGQLQVREGAGFFGSARREYSAVASASINGPGATRLRLAAQGRRLDAGPVESTVDLALEQGLFGGHRVTVRGLAASESRYGWRPRMQVEYAIPLGVPIPGRGAGRVVTRVYDAATGDGLADVVVRLGDRLAVTDRRGFAEFAGIAPGSHLLRIEPGAGPERVADRDLPVPVEVGEGGAARVDVGLERAGRVTGRVMRTGPGADTIPAPLPGVTVEITGPAGRRRAVTDSEGRFVIAGVRPGWWRVTLPADGLPRFHEAGDEPIVQVHPGSTEAVDLRAVERERPVQMIQSGELSLP